MRSEATTRGVVLANPASLKTQISRWENGHCQPDYLHRSVLCSVYGQVEEDLGLVSHAGEDGLGLGVSESWAEGVCDVTALWQADLTRRAVLKGSAFAVGAFGTPALKWMVGDRGSIPSGTGAVALGRPEISSIQEMTSGFRRLDNAFGGGAAREQAVRFLDREVAPLLAERNYGGALGLELSRATAELTQLVGWMAYDEGSHGLAQRYFIQALNLARAADDRLLGAEVLAAMSHQASYLGEGASAVDLARAAGRTAAQQGGRVLVAEAFVLEAQGHAVRGDSHACVTALGEAETALDKADRSGEPAWLAYFDEAYVSAKFGQCFRSLGRGVETERFALRSLEMDNRYVRGRAFNLALVADAFALQGEIEVACRWGAQAVTLARDLRSARVLTSLVGVSKRLGEHGGSTADQFRGDVDRLVSVA